MMMCQSGSSTGERLIMGLTPHARLRLLPALVQLVNCDALEVVQFSRWGTLIHLKRQQHVCVIQSEQVLHE